MNLKGGCVYIISLARLVAILTLCLVASCSDSSKVKYPEVKGPWGNETDCEITDTGVSPLSNKFFWLDNDNLLFSAKQSLFFEDNSEWKDGRIFVVWNQVEKKLYPLSGYDINLMPTSYCHYEDGRLVVGLMDRLKNSRFMGGKHKYYKVYLESKSGEYSVKSMSEIDYDPDKKIMRCGPRYHIVDRGDPLNKPEVYLDKVGGKVNWYLDGESVYIDSDGGSTRLYTYEGRDNFQYISWENAYFYGAKSKSEYMETNRRELITYMFRKDGVVETRYPSLGGRSSGQHAFITKKGIIYISSEKREGVRSKGVRGVYIRYSDGGIKKIIEGVFDPLYSSSVSYDGCKVAISHDGGSGFNKVTKIVDVCHQGEDS